MHLTQSCLRITRDLLNLNIKLQTDFFASYLIVSQCIFSIRDKPLQESNRVQQILSHHVHLNDPGFDFWVDIIDRFYN